MRSPNLFFICIVLIQLFYSCAQLGTPTGGLVDQTPPEMLSILPENLSISVPISQDKIHLQFDEYVTLDKSSPVIISPPLSKPPSFYPVSIPKKYLDIIFNDNLLPDTTYQFYFGQNISDLNEKNKLESFTYIFSTGNYLDSLSIRGNVKTILRKNEKLDKVVLGLYLDSIKFKEDKIQTIKPRYLAFSDSLGNFEFNYLAPNQYKLFAFLDETQNFRPEPEQELLGFYSDEIPLKESLDSIHIGLFNQQIKYSALQASQSGYGLIGVSLKGFNEKDSVAIKFLDKEIKDFHQVALEDSLSVWFNPDQMNRDKSKTKKIKMVLTHELQKDTLYFFYKEKDKPKLIVNNLPYDKSILTDIKFKANTPIDKINKDSIMIKIQDSLHLKFDAFVLKNKTDLILKFDKNWGKKYDVEFLPGALEDIFGNKNDSIVKSFSTGATQNYGKLILNWDKIPRKPFIIELRNDKNNSLAFSQYIIKDKNLEIDNLSSNTYNIIIKVDENQDGKWQTGDVFNRRQPEPIYYFEPIEIREIWEINETIDLSEYDL